MIMGFQGAAEAGPARVGHKAPDFRASSFSRGGFDEIQLSALLGKWVVLFFYPGDFTFV